MVPEVISDVEFSEKRKCIARFAEAGLPIFRSTEPMVNWPGMG
jgi:hypothetical protein